MANRTASFPAGGTRGRLSSTGLVASSESSLAVQAPPIKPISRTSLHIGQLRSRLSPNSLTPSSMTLLSRHSCELSTSNRSPLSIFPSPRLCHASSSFLFLSHSLVAPFFPVRLPLCCQSRCHGLLIRFLFSFLSHFTLSDAFCRQNVGRDVS